MINLYQILVYIYNYLILMLGLMLGLVLMLILTLVYDLMKIIDDVLYGNFYNVRFTYIFLCFM